MSTTSSRHLLIADTTGYTRYLTSSEHEHALQSAGERTIVTVTTGKAREPFLNRMVCNVVARPLLRRTFRKGFEEIRRMIAEERAGGTLHVPDRATPATGDVTAGVASSFGTDG